MALTEVDLDNPAATQGTTGRVLRADDEFGTRVLVVEPHPFFARVLQTRLEEQLKIELIVARTFAEAQAMTETDDGKLFLALVDANLSDCEPGIPVDYFTERDLPVIVVANRYDSEQYEDVLTRGAIDYVVRESGNGMEYLLSLIRRVQRNASMTAIVVDNNESRRSYVAEQLRLFRLRVMETSSAELALQSMEVADNVKLVVTAFKIGGKDGMDGADLTRKIRSNYTKEDVSIIGLSSSAGSATSARFIKLGANDFLRAPFEREEFFCRVTQNLDLMEYISALNAAATRDFLTGLFNRRHFFDVADPMLMAARRHNAKPVVAMMDIDHFKKINDTYGHDAGDEVLKKVGEVLDSAVRKSDLVARLGGEEFAIFSPDMDPQHAFEIFDSVRQKIEDTPVNTAAGVIHVTMSVGVSTAKADLLSEMLNAADRQLYAAKNGGRNRVEISRHA